MSNAPNSTIDEKNAGEGKNQIGERSKSNRGDAVPPQGKGREGAFPRKKKD